MRRQGIAQFSHPRKTEICLPPSPHAKSDATNENGRFKRSTAATQREAASLLFETRLPPPGKTFGGERATIKVVCGSTGSEDFRPPGLSTYKVFQERKSVSQLDCSLYPSSVRRPESTCSTGKQGCFGPVAMCLRSERVLFRLSSRAPIRNCHGQ